MDQHRAVRFEDEEADGFREMRIEAAGVGDFAAGDKQAHARTVLSVSDMFEAR
jgi:hypothetical protein